MARRAADTVTLALNFADGSVGIMTLVVREFNSDGSVRWEKQADASYIDPEIARASLSFAPEKVPVKGWTPIDPSDIPSDRTFRNALTHNGKEFGYDMAKARELKRAALRAEREPQLAALDTAYLRADEIKDDATKATIAAQKQVLRDVTADPLIEAAVSVEDLLNFDPLK